MQRAEIDGRKTRRRQERWDPKVCGGVNIGNRKIKAMAFSSAFQDILLPSGIAIAEEKSAISLMSFLSRSPTFFILAVC